MASGTFTFGTSNQYIEGRIRWSSSSNGSSANSSNVTAYLDYKKSSASTAATYGTFGGTININGSSKGISLALTLQPNNAWVNVGSHSVTIGHNADGTKSIYIQASGGISGTSFSSSSHTQSGIGLDTIPRYAKITGWTFTEQTQTSITMQVTTDVACSKIEYRIGNGSYITVNNSIFTIENLAPNTTYSFQCRVTRKDSNLTTESSSVTVKTLPIATLKGNFDINIGSDLNIDLIDSEYNASTLKVSLLKEDNSWSEDLLTANAEQNAKSISLPLSTIADTLFSLCSTRNSATLRISCGVMLGEIYYENFYYGTAVVTDNNPIFTNFSYSNTDSVTKNVLGNSSYIIENYGNMQAQITTANKAQGQHYATILRYIATVKDSSGITKLTLEAPYSDTDTVLLDFGTLSLSGTYTINIHAIDSRSNLSSVVTKTFHVLPYRRPSADILLQRHNQYEKETTITLSAFYSKLMVGSTQKNSSFRIQYRFAEFDEQLPATYTNLTGLISDMKFSETDVKVTYSNLSTTEPFQILDSSKAYHFEFVLTDRICSVVKKIDVVEGIPIMIETDTGKVAIGMLPEMDNSSNFQVSTDILATDSTGKRRLILESIDGLDAKIKGLVEDICTTNSDLFYTLWLNMHPVGMIILDTTGVNPGNIYGGTWELWGAGRVPVCINESDNDFSEAEKMGGAKTHKLTENELPLIDGTMILHGQESGTGVYETTGHFYGTTMSGKYRTASTVNGAYSKVNVGYKFGGGGTHNNLQPYITCYFWKRIS
ncbi:DUF859 family phage minor structural protein [Bariatricus sp. SGI.154]|uniref:DUF859 family phage minor structural protein n=1 Tax=Bariatricus sp. SGI.154 TaxID=3420549 RepID=UPI003D08ED4C